MNALNLVVSRRVVRGTVRVDGALYYGAGLEMCGGEVVDIVVRPGSALPAVDGSAFADLGGAPLELTRIG